LRRTTEVVQKAELRGEKIINQQIGNELANETGAVKFIDYSPDSGRGVKILMDEIAYAGLSKIKDEKEAKRSKKCNCCDIL